MVAYTSKRTPVTQKCDIRYKCDKEKEFAYTCKRKYTATFAVLATCSWRTLAVIFSSTKLFAFSFIFTRIWMTRMRNF